MKTPTLMIQGTTSDAGKSTLVAGLGRILQRKGIHVAPFKPQNMALNSAVTVAGGEIGRAQALQAAACKVVPHTDMNPVLLKPNSDTGAQVIIQGEVRMNLEAQAYHDYKKTAMVAVLESYRRLSSQYELILVEGAGSPAEINLRENDIANMGFAEAVDCPVVIVADIDRGGVFAQLMGTLNLLSASEQNRTRGFVINRFRGALELLQPGLDWLEQHSNKHVFGVLPYVQGLYLDAEDAIISQQTLLQESEQDSPQCSPQGSLQRRAFKIIVPVFSRISNHTDFDVLRANPLIDLEYIGPGQTPPPADLIILPGSKSVRADLRWLQENKWVPVIHQHLRYGGKLLGICGGFQMLGHNISDPDGVESTAGESRGLGLLDINTTLTEKKCVRQVTGILNLGQIQVPVKAYEIHCGHSYGKALDRPLIKLEDGHEDGCLSDDNQILGCYLHGLFDQPEAADAILKWAGLTQAHSIDMEALREQELDRIADIFEQHLDLHGMLPDEISARL